MSQATVAASMLHSLLDHLGGDGMDTAALAEAAGLDMHDLAYPERLLDGRFYTALMRAGIQASHNPLLGLEFGMAAQPQRWGTIGLLLRHCVDLGEALAVQARFAHLVNSVGTARFAQHENHVNLEWHVDGRVMPAITEEALAAWVRFGRWASGHSHAPIRVMFRHRAQGDPAVYHAFFGCPVHYSGPSNSLQFDSAILDVPLRTPDTQLTTILAEQVTARQQARHAQELNRRLHDWLLARLGPDTPDLGTAATFFGMSERMLQHRLYACGTCFRDALDAARRELAQEYLRDARLSIGDISLKLGFSEQSAFQRAFRRWHGMTPLAWRRRPAP